MKRLFNFLWSNIKKFIKTRKNETEKEYSKRMLDWVLKHCIFMMWCSYVLAFIGRITIAESLSETIARVIVGAIVSYFASKTFENVNKYGSRLNNTAIDMTAPSPIPSDDSQDNIIISTDDQEKELEIDC